MIVRRSFAIFVTVRGEADDVSAFEKRAYDAVTHAPHAKLSLFSVSRTHDAYRDEDQHPRIEIKP